MSLKDEILEKKKEIIVDSYPMSIGEVSNVYRDGELDVHPEFQRFFRWEDSQKTRLIESILLGIPIPPIFVAQKTDGKWDVIDGQQRLSTVLQFLQLLKDDNNELYPPLVLHATKFLPSLEGVTWTDDEKFPSDLRILFKRAKLDFTIIKETDGNSSSKYEMFQRLNTGGTRLSPQEIRNCLLIMFNKELFEQIHSLSKKECFNNCIPLSENKFDEQYNLELIVKSILFLTLPDNKIDNVDKSRNMDDFVTEEIEIFAKTDCSDFMQNFEITFDRTFSLLSDIMQENAFKKCQDNRYKGALLASAFESIIPGLMKNIDYWEKHRNLLESKIKQIYEQDPYKTAIARGVRPISRMMQLIRFSEKWFSNENQ
ncbi:MAG: DUF262 domain-containing protein [Treponema sp.]|nr:DUF262 domain-containing protein [Treponema sp.]